jgi:hypothetical protein
MLRMHEELDGNKKGNSWEHIGNNKDPTADPPPKDKKIWPTWLHGITSLAARRFFCLPIFFAIFGLG